MAEGVRGQEPAARRALDEALLDQERLDDLLDGVARLRQTRRDGLDPDRPAAVIERDGRQVAPVHRVEPGGVDFELAKRAIGDDAIDLAVARDQREVAHAAQQPSGNARRAAGAAGDLVGAVRRHADAQNARAAIDDLLELGLGIEIEPDRDAEAVAQRVGQEARARGRAHQRELREIDLDRARRRPGADDEVELEILHGGIEDFLDRRIEPMDLVDEQNVAIFEISEQRGEIAGLGDHWAGGGAEIDAELARQDLRQRGLAEPGRTDEQRVIERFAPRARRLDEHAEIGARLLLADELRQPLRAAATARRCRPRGVQGVTQARRCAHGVAVPGRRDTYQFRTIVQHTKVANRQVAIMTAGFRSALRVGRSWKPPGCSGRASGMAPTSTPVAGASTSACARRTPARCRPGGPRLPPARRRNSSRTGNAVDQRSRGRQRRSRTRHLGQSGAHPCR